MREEADAAGSASLAGDQGRFRDAIRIGIDDPLGCEPGALEERFEIIGNSGIVEFADTLDAHEILGQFQHVELGHFAFSLVDYEASVNGAMTG